MAERGVRDHRPLAVALIALLLGAVTFWSVTIDDAYITARYAMNLADGHGPVFNVGERVEGYSDPTWLLVMTVASVVSAAAVLPFAKIVGVACTALLFVLSVRHWQQNRVASGAALGALVLFLLLPPVHFWTVAGLETTAYAVLSVCALLLAARAEPGMKTSVFAGTVVALAALTRPEGAALFLVVLAVTAGSMLRTRGRVEPRSLVAFCGAFALLFGAYLAFRVAYFGELVPNTFLAKPGGPGHLKSGVEYVLEAFANPAALILLFTTAVGVAVTRTRSLLLVGLTAAGLLQTLFTVWAGGDWMPEHRFAVQIWALLLIPSGFGLSTVWAWGRSYHRKTVVVALAVVAAAGCLWQFNAFRIAHDNYDWRLSSGLNTRISLGKWLDDQPPVTVGYGDMGALPFHANSQRFIDFNGLVDKKVANVIHQERDDEDRAISASVLQRNPDVVILVAERPSASDPGDLEYGEYLLGDPAFGSIYRYRASLTAYPPGVVPEYSSGRYLLFYSRGSEVLPGLEGAVAEANGELEPRRARAG